MQSERILIMIGCSHMTPPLASGRSAAPSGVTLSRKPFQGRRSADGGGDGSAVPPHRLGIQRTNGGMRQNG